MEQRGEDVFERFRSVSTVSIAVVPIDFEVDELLHSAVENAEAAETRVRSDRITDRNDSSDGRVSQREENNRRR